MVTLMPDVCFGVPARPAAQMGVVPASSRMQLDPPRPPCSHVFSTALPHCLARQGATVPGLEPMQNASDNEAGVPSMRPMLLRQLTSAPH